MPTVKFLLKGDDGNDYWAEWLPEDYLVEIGGLDGNEEC